MNKVIASLLMIGVVAAMAGAGTFAYFTDTETSVDNTFTAGTLDLDGAGSIENVAFSDMIPGGNPDAQYIELRNLGTMAGAETEFDFNYNATTPFVDDEDREVDTLGAADGSDSKTTFANKIIVDQLDFGSTSLLTGTGLEAGVATLKAVINHGTFYGESLDVYDSTTPANAKDLTIEVHLDSGAGNICQGDELSIDIEIGLNQEETLV